MVIPVAEASDGMLVGFAEVALRSYADGCTGGSGRLPGGLVLFRESLAGRNRSAVVRLRRSRVQLP
jgi:hypothetical protein